MKNLVLLQATLIFVIFVQSCNGQNFESIIEKYNNVDFSELRNSSIYPRSPGTKNNTTRYFINVFKGDCSPYMVDADDKEIISINNDLVLKSCGKDYLNTEKIEQLFKAYMIYKLCLIQVDSVGNVYMNPDKAERPILLRKLPGSTPKDINLYKKYKGNWYVRK